MVDIYSTKILIRYREFYYIYFITSIISSPLFINLQWRMFGLDENYTGDLRTVKINTAITFKEKLSFAIATPASDSEANLISVVKSTSTELNNIIVNIKGVVTGGSNGQIRVFFVGK